MHDQKREVINHNKVTVDPPYSWVSMQCRSITVGGYNGEQFLYLQNNNY